MRYAVGYLNFYDNDLQIKIVDAAGDWKMALLEAGYADMDILAILDADIAKAKINAIDQDWIFDVKEIPTT